MAKDTIIRNYWVEYDMISGADGEEVFKNRERAYKFYTKLNPENISYKRISAEYYDREEILESWRNADYYRWMDSDSDKPFFAWLRNPA